MRYLFHLRTYRQYHQHRQLQFLMELRWKGRHPHRHQQLNLVHLRHLLRS
jgi:hypothetical protein